MVNLKKIYDRKQSTEKKRTIKKYGHKYDSKQST